MKFLFLHNNFPGQFHRISVALATNPEHKVVFLSLYKRSDLSVPGVEWRQVPLFRKGEKQVTGTPYIPPLRQAELFADAMLALQKESFSPDVIHGHVPFGGMLYAPDVFPQARQAGYFEWMYAPEGDKAFAGELSAGPMHERVAQRHTNMCVLSGLDAATVGICPTIWQRAQHPSIYYHKLRVLHDGVDQDFYSPQEGQHFSVEGVDLEDAELITYATRGLEPYRGFHTFYRSLPAVLEARPKAHVIIMAHDRSFYGPSREDGKSWGQALYEEVQLDERRVHFLPFQPYQQYRGLLRASDVHVYLTAPLMLSWSLLEAMSCGCLVVASDTEPVREVVQHEYNGLLTHFTNSDMLARRIIQALADKDALQYLRKNARNTVLKRYASKNLLTQHVRLLEHDVFCSKEN